MGIFGQFEYGEDVYGPDGAISTVELITDKLIRVTYTTAVSVDSAYKDETSYAISLVSGTGPVTIKSILVPSTTSSTETLLVLDRTVEGSLYEVSVTGLSSTAAQSVSGTARFFGRRTKTDAILSTLPTIYDKRPTAIVAVLSAAIGIEDDLIGGSRDDTL